MAPVIPGAQLWTDLEVEIWRATKESKSDRGVGSVRIGARRRWDGMDPETQRRTELSLRQWRAAQVHIMELRPVYGTVPDKTDLPAIKTYHEAAEALAVAMRSSNSSLEELRTLRRNRNESGYVTAEWLASQEMYSEDLIDEANEASTKCFRIRQAAEQQESLDEDAAGRPDSDNERHREHETLVQEDHPPGLNGNNQNSHPPDGRENDEQEDAAALVPQDLEDMMSLHRQRSPLVHDDFGEQDHVAARDEAEAYRRVDFIRQSRGMLDSRWVGPIELGKDASGQCNAWVKQNSRGVIVDRIVIKDARGGQSTATDLHDATNLSTEIAAMLKLRGLQGSSSIVKLRNWRTYSGGQWEFRIYMEYCGGGDLHTLMKKYWPYKSQHDKTDVPASKGLWIPEPFLWAVLESLVTAGLLMERGNAEKGPGGLYNAWEPIVHGDLTLANGEISDVIIAIGDFGGTIIADHGKTRLPEDLFEGVEGIGTPFARAPELKADINDGVTFALDTKTNVWGVGFLLWALINGVQSAGLKDFSLESSKGKKPATFSPDAEKKYSATLLDLIMDCLEYTPESRPRFDDIMATVRRNTGHGKQDRARRLKYASQDDFGFTKYAIWAERDRRPVRSMLDLDMLTEKESQALQMPPAAPSRPAQNDGGTDDSSSESSGDEDDDDLGGMQGKLILSTKAAEKKFERQEVNARKDGEESLKRRAESRGALGGPAAKRPNTAG